MRENLNHLAPTLKANKKLGQHFLIDESIIEKIVAIIEPKITDNLLEIGPGLGAITLPILRQYKKLTVIELDNRVIPILEKNSKKLGQLTIIKQDVLNIDYKSLLQNKNWLVFGNLPYNISTPILFILSTVKNITDMVFMLQKEVIERIVAQPGEKNYGRLSIMLQYYHDVYSLFEVPPKAFNPQPKVMSKMISIKRLPKPRWYVTDKCLFTKVVKQAFSMRRKTLKNSLKPLISSKSLAAINIDASHRAEVISGSQFADIANFLAKKKS